GVRCSCAGILSLYPVRRCIFTSRRRHTISKRDWSSDVRPSDLRGTVGQQRGDVAEYHTRFGMVGNGGDEGLRAGEFSSVHASTILGGPAQPLSGSGWVLKSSAPDRTLPQSRTYAGRRVPWHPIATG